MVRAVVERLESWYEIFARRLGKRGMLAISALSMVWGIVSGISLTRDYAHSSRLVGYLALLVLVSVVFRIWLEYARRVQAAAREVAGVRGILLEKPHLVENLALTATQYAIQYIMMFCIPLLALAHAWVTLGLAVTLVVSSLVDRWWIRLSRQAWYTASVRMISAVVATSFAFAVFFPKDLVHFHEVLGCVAALGAIPWGLALERRRPKVLDLAPCLAVLLLIGAQTASGSRIVRVPLLSVWLKRPVIGAGLDGRSLKDVWGKETPRAKLAAALAEGDDVCCLTPIVSPSGVEAAVTHEWLVNGHVIDRIDLPPVRGRDDTEHGAFRTYSCKHNLPPAASVQELRCRVFLAGIYLGKAEVVFSGGPH